MSVTHTRTLQKQRSSCVHSDDGDDNDDGIRLSSFDMWALGITIVIGGQYFAWNEGLSAGFGSFAVATFFIASAYLCLVLCVAELSSGLPFAGGSYGLARVTAGIYPGYLVACFDSIESVVYVSATAVLIGQTLTAIFHTSRNFEPLYWFIFYVSALAIHCYGGKTFWRINTVLAIASFLILVVYILGSLRWVDFHAYAVLQEENDLGEKEGDKVWFEGGMHEFMRVVSLPSWFFVGIESINLACQDIQEPKKNIPKGYLFCMGTLLVTCVCTLFVASSLPPGVFTLKDSLAPLSYGFRHIFNCSNEVAFILSLPALYATAFGFMFCYGRQLRSMGNSGIVNSALGVSWEKRQTPVAALCVGSTIGYMVCLLTFFLPSVGSYLFHVCMLGAFGAYTAQFMSYIVFCTVLSNIEREFRSPLGIYGAVYGTVVFLTAFISIAFFQEDKAAILVFSCYVISVTVYYYLVVKKRQFFSEEEKGVLLVAHIIKSNLRKQSKNRKPKTFLQKTYLSFQVYVVNLLATKEGESKSKGQVHPHTNTSVATLSTVVNSTSEEMFDDVEKDEEKETELVKVVVKEERRNDPLYELADDAPPGITGGIARVLSRALSSSASYVATVVGVTETEEVVPGGPSGFTRISSSAVANDCQLDVIA